MCSEVFRNGVRDTYVISLFAFCIVRGQTLQNNTWYSSDLLFSCLIDVLDDISFDPTAWSSCYKISLKKLVAPFIVAIPSLILLYILRY